MKDRTTVRDLRGRVGQTVSVMGFADTVRNQKQIQFLVLRDHTGKAQMVHSKANGPDGITETIKSLSLESAIVVTGMVVEAPNVKLGGIELQIQSIEVSSVAESPLPITAESVLDKQMDWRQLSLRQPKNLLIFQIQTTMENAMRSFWLRRDFIEIHSPKLMGTASESGAELFSLPYFNDWTAYLAQSPQFYKQMAMAAGFDRIFEIGPVFRANPSMTSRHDTEFTSVDMEISWIESHEDIMHFEEEWLAYVLAKVEEKHGDAIKETFGVELIVPTTPFPRMSLADARAILAKKGHVINHKEDLDPPGERLLSAHVREELGHEFIFVTDYPAEVRAFYHMRHPDRPDLTKSFDLLWKGLEITTGAQREHRLEKLKEQAIDRGFAHGPLEHYFNFFRYGCPPHGGCGVGLTRLLMIILGRSNVREVTFLYRGMNRLTP